MVDLLLPYDSTLAPLRRGLMTLTQCAVEYRNPGERATTRRMKAAMRRAERVSGDKPKRLALLF